MQPTWIKNYPPNCKSEIDTAQFRSMLDIYQNTIDGFSDKTAYVSFGKKITYLDVHNYCTDFGAYLQNELGIIKGERIALMCPNTFSFAIAMWGIIRIGGVQVSINPLYTSHELKHQLNDAQVETIIIFSASTAILADIIEQTNIKNIIVINLDDLVKQALPNESIDARLNDTLLFTDAIKRGKELTLNSPELTQQDLLFLQYTGGTTGLSKGAMLTHGNLIANICQYSEFAKHFIKPGEETVITAIPMYHIFALCVNTLCYFSFGAENVLITNPRDMPAFIEIWKKTKATFVTGVNTLFNGLLHTPGFEEIDFSMLKLTVGGGAPVQQAVSERWKDKTGNGIKEGYGLSETSPVLCLNLTPDSEQVNGIGVPLPSTSISIRDDNGQAVKQGKPGELCAKGPQIMQGYWQNSAATAESMTADGYFKTGDIAVLDANGYFHIVDRKKDMILVSGFNVYPNEIEAKVAKMPGIKESACIGVEDQKTGEAAKLFAVKIDITIKEQDVINFCREHLASYKVPKQVVFIDELPKSTVGKLLRRELRKL